MSFKLVIKIRFSQFYKNDFMVWEVRKNDKIRSLARRQDNKTQVA